MEKKKYHKSGFIFGSLLSVYFVVVQLLTTDSLTTNEILKAVATGLLQGAITGFLWSRLMAAFENSKFVNQTTKIDTEPGEEVLYQSPANHFTSIEAVGGKLYLTNKRLVFKSHAINIQNHQLSIARNNITGVAQYKTLGFINNGLMVTTAAGTTEKFLVHTPAAWAKHVTNTFQQPVVAGSF